MTAFLASAAALLLFALAVLTRPWWWRRQAVEVSRQSLNAAIYRDQLAELDRDRASGQLPEADYEVARSEIQRRLLDDAIDGETAAGTAGSRRRTAVGLLLLMPLAAMAMYAVFGNPAGLDAMARRDFSRADIDRMVASLAAKLENEPENHQGWAMLARSYKAMHRPEDAKRAYDKAWPLVEKDPQLLADYADLLASANGGELAGRPEELVAMALKIDPDHVLSLWLAGTAAFNRGDFGAAASHWERARKQLPADSEDAKMLASVIDEARQKQQGQGAKKPGKR